jgi:BASS family bile acid:Na+ symporter
MDIRPLYFDRSICLTYIKYDAMFRINDLILLLVIFLSVLVAILVPRIGAPFQPFPLYLMMLLLFLSFLAIRLDAILHIVKGFPRSILFLSFLKTIALPIGIYFLCKVLYPSYAIAALLLSGISTGVVAPFISNVVKANSPLVLVMVVITSLIAPFTLPAIAKMLLSRSVDISMWSMVRMLCLVLLVPIGAVETLRRIWPRFIAMMMKRQFPLSLATIALVNLGVFSRYAAFFRQKPSTILEALVVAIVLAGIYLLFGIFAFPRGRVENQLSAAISMGNINNVLIIVFASQFFGPLEPTVAAMYIFPFFGLIIPLRIYRQWRQHKA